MTKTATFILCGLTQNRNERRVYTRVCIRACTAPYTVMICALNIARNSLEQACMYSSGDKFSMVERYILFFVELELF